MTRTAGAAADIDDFRSSVETWLDDNQRTLAPSYAGTGTLDEQMAQLSKVKRLAYDAGWMRFGWPEHVGGLGGSTLMRA
jgi:alkylation response protein AidB-like acyl-CoA dehydrogenase